MQAERARLQALFANSDSGAAVVVWGETLWDVYDDGPRLGGAPANVAWHLGLADNWVRLITRVGDDALGRQAIQRLGEVIDPELFQVDPALPTGQTLVRLDAQGEPAYRLQTPAAWQALVFDEAVAYAVSDASAFVYGTLALGTEAGLAAWRAAHAACPSECLRVCDPNLRPGVVTPALREAILGADVVKLSEAELRMLGEVLGWQDPLAALLAQAPRVVAVTRGQAGSRLYTAHEVLDVPAFPATGGGDAVGCGDAYTAILVHGLLHGWSLADSGLAASAWAAQVASARGAMPYVDVSRV